MDVAEHILKIKSIIKELENLAAYASPIKQELYFEPAVRLHAQTSMLVIEADRIGNASTESAESLVKSWFTDKNWEAGL